VLRTQANKRDSATYFREQFSGKQTGSLRKPSLEGRGVRGEAVYADPSLSFLRGEGRKNAATCKFNVAGAKQDIC
jgi:hypothetical protein